MAYSLGPQTLLHYFLTSKIVSSMIHVVAAVIERPDRRILIGQRRRGDTSPLKWEFPGGKVRSGESFEQALSRELREELGVTLVKSVVIASVRHQYANTPEDLDIHFFAAQYAEPDLSPHVFEQIAWVLPRELSSYDFLAANRQLIAQLATGRIKPAELLSVV
jgi:8-oxo-dGTP diphosphatase